MRRGGRKPNTASSIVTSTVGARPVWMTFVGPLAAVVAVLAVFALRHIEPVQGVTSPVCGAWMPVAEVGMPFLINLHNVDALAAVQEDDVWVIGRGSQTVDNDDEDMFYFLHWDGKEASFVPHNIPEHYANQITDMEVISSDDIWAVGDYPQMIHWDGTEWKIVDTGISGRLNSISAAAKDDIWAVGAYNSVDDTKPLLMHWDGSAWTKSPEPSDLLGHAILYDVTAVSQNEVWAVGGGGNEDLVLWWRGDKWYKVDPVMAGMGKANRFAEECGNPYVAVSSNATEDGDVWVVGSCSKQSEINKGYEYVSEGLTAEVVFQRHIDLMDNSVDTHLYEIKGHQSSDMWALGVVGESMEETALWHTTGNIWERMPLPYVGAKAYWRNMDVLEDGTVWLAGDADGRMVLAKFVPSLCNGAILQRDLSPDH